MIKINKQKFSFKICLNFFKLPRLTTLLLISSLGLSQSCAQWNVNSLGKKTTMAEEATNQAELEGDIDPHAPAVEDPEYTDSEKETIPKIPVTVEVNPHVEKWIHYFTERGKERFQRYLVRGQRYKSVVQTILEENDIPNELYYLAMIESGYTTHAYSSAAAVGVWQFIPATARRYGLVVNNYLDERRDPIRATESAAKYLNDLYNVYQSWELAMASYNCGEVCVLRAVMKGKTRNFWDLVKKGLLPKETSDYVPKFMAAVLIGQEPEKYGFEDPVNLVEEEFPSVEAVEVPSPIHLQDVAKLSNIPIEKLMDTNPHLTKGITPPDQNVYEIWIPTEQVSLVKNLSEQLAQNIYPEKLAKKETHGAYKERKGKSDRRKGSSSSENPHYYTVKRGDTLSKISQKFKISVTYLKRINGIKRSAINPGQKLRITARSYAAVAKNQKYYRVKRGDTLEKIAKRYGSSVTLIKKENNLRGSRIHIGQKLIIPQVKGESVSSSASSKSHLLNFTSLS